MAENEKEDPVSTNEAEREVAKGEAFKLAQAMKDAVDNFFEERAGINQHAILFGALGMLFDHFLRTTPNQDLRIRHALVDGFADVLHQEINHPSEKPSLN